MQSDEDRIRALPCWKGGVAISILKGGLSNANYLVKDAAGDHVVRFGTDYPFHHVFREREVMVARAAHAAGLAPEVQYAQHGVMVTAFIGARTYAGDDVRSNAARIGRLLRRFHEEMPSRVTGPGFMFWVFHVIRDYAATLTSASSPHAATLPKFLAEATALEAVQVPLPIIFGHNDLLPGNFLDDGDRLWLIDFEYAGFNTAMFDLAGAASNALMTDDESLELLTAYFGVEPSDSLIKSFDAMQCASLSRETLWAMVSGLYLNAPGVDYDAYTAENLSRYEMSLDRYQSRHGKLLP
jgi:thiamine kinase-like enzyme